MKIKDVLKACEEALCSCYDNYGSEGADNGEYEKSYDDKLIGEAKHMIFEYKKSKGMLKLCKCGDYTENKNGICSTCHMLETCIPSTFPKPKPFIPAYPKKRILLKKLKRFK